MKIKYPPKEIHHYHHIYYRKNPIRWIVFGVLTLGPLYTLLKFINKKTNGEILSVINSLFEPCFSSYWHGINRIAVFCGLSKGFGFFWQEYPLIAVVIFLGIPILFGIAIALLLKKDLLMYQVVLLLYLWHSGQDILIHAHTPWMMRLIIVGLIFSLMCCNQFILALVVKGLTFIKPVIHHMQPHIKTREN